MTIVSNRTETIIDFISYSMAYLTITTISYNATFLLAIIFSLPKRFQSTKTDLTWASIFLLATLTSNNLHLHVHQMKISQTSWWYWCFRALGVYLKRTCTETLLMAKQNIPTMSLLKPRFISNNFRLTSVYKSVDNNTCSNFTK